MVTNKTSKMIQNRPKDGKHEFQKRTASRRDDDLKKNKKFATIKNARILDRVASKYDSRGDQPICRTHGASTRRRFVTTNAHDAPATRRAQHGHRGLAPTKRTSKLKKTHGVSTRRAKLGAIMVSVPNDNYL